MKILERISLKTMETYKYLNRTFTVLHTKSGLIFAFQTISKASWKGLMLATSVK